MQAGLIIEVHRHDRALCITLTPFQRTDNVDRALIMMAFTFACISVACGTNVADIFHQQRRLWVQLQKSHFYCVNRYRCRCTRGSGRRSNRTFSQSWTIVRPVVATKRAHLPRDASSSASFQLKRPGHWHWGRTAALRRSCSWRLPSDPRATPANR